MPPSCSETCGFCREPLPADGFSRRCGVTRSSGLMLVRAVVSHSVAKAASVAVNDRTARLGLQGRASSGTRGKHVSEAPRIRRHRSHLGSGRDQKSKAVRRVSPPKRAPRTAAAATDAQMPLQSVKHVVKSRASSQHPDRARQSPVDTEGSERVALRGSSLHTSLDRICQKNIPELN